jgi:hypothetical protein
VVQYDHMGRPLRSALACYCDWREWRMTERGALCITVEGCTFALREDKDGWRWWMKWEAGEIASMHARYRSHYDARDDAWRKWCAVTSAMEA